jgi:hypothetical protein
MYQCLGNIHDHSFCDLLLLRGAEFTFKTFSYVECETLLIRCKGMYKAKELVYIENRGSWGLCTYSVILANFVEKCTKL